MKTPLSKKRPVEALHLLLKERKTTAPRLEGDTERTGKGPPQEGLEKMLGFLTKIPSLGLYLLTHLVDKQRFEDATGWWPGAGDYLERVARFMKMLKAEMKEQAAFLQDLPFTAEDLLYRLGRIKLLEMVVERTDELLSQLRSTLLVERADAMRMADVVMTEVEMMLGRPTFTGAPRAALTSLAAMPLSLWHKWQESIQETARRNEKLRSERQEEIDAANRSAAAARAVAKLATGQPVSDGEALLAAGLSGNLTTPPPAGRRSRRR